MLTKYFRKFAVSKSKNQIAIRNCLIIHRFSNKFNVSHHPVSHLVDPYFSSVNLTFYFPPL